MTSEKAPVKQSKSDFIRSQPNTMSAGEIVAKAKAEGIKLSGNLVYMVRGPRGKATRKSATSKKSPVVAKRVAASTGTSAKKTASSTKPGESKADFVRARAHLSPKEIVEDAKARSVKLDPSYVYKVRGYDMATANRKARASKRSAAVATVAKSSATNGTRSSRSTSSVEDLLRAAAAELGLGRAIEILQGERARVRAVIGG